MPNDPVTTPAPAPAPAPTEGPVTRAELADFTGKVVEALQGHATSINGQLTQWSSRFAAAPGAPAQPAAKPAPGSDPDDGGLLMRIAKGDLGGIDERVISTLKDTGVISYLATQARNAASSNEAAARANIDTEFGEGTYEKQLKPLVDALLGDSVTARSDPQTFTNALSAAKGQRFNDLVTARTTRESAAAAARTAAEAAARANSPWMPGNGFLPGASPNALDEDDAARLRRIGEWTGGNIPKVEQAAKLRDLTYRKGVDGVSMEELSEIFGAAGA